MRYAEFASDKTYIVMLNHGFGVMEAPYEEVCMVYDTNDKEDAYKHAKMLYQSNNTPSEIQSTWANNTYQIHVNTKTEEGKRLLAEFQEQFDKKYNNFENLPDGSYSDIQIRGFNLRIIKNPILDSFSTGFKKRTQTAIFIDTNNIK